ncbi:MAG: PhnD/SsuA/transferrin family substrate-binding protein [Bryobacterales bacterium]|nr:PhnD/SsuA/transferrin family substrate-binding protein [Bryobacterales bacterium]
MTAPCETIRRQNAKSGLAPEALSALSSRRRALALALGLGHWLPGALAATEAAAPLRLAISESLVTDVNMNDARAAMRIWIQLISKNLNLVVEFNPKVFETTEEVMNRVRRGLCDSAAINVVEYRQLSDVLDPSLLIASAGTAGQEQYILLAKRNGGVGQLGDLRGRRLISLTTPRMCVASAWLSTILAAGHFGPGEKFFGPMIIDSKVSRVVLPVFFGQADACLTTKRSFDTMCELNPQVAKDLVVIAASPTMVVSGYMFRRGYKDPNREKLIKALSSLRGTPSGRQLATLFQFEEVAPRDAGCLAGALAILAAAERTQGHQGAGGRNG